MLTLSMTNIDDYALAGTKFAGMRLRDLLPEEIQELWRYSPPSADMRAVREYCRLRADRARQNRRAA